MRTIICKEVVVSFRPSHKNGQFIQANNLTACNYLEVQEVGGTLVIRYMHIDAGMSNDTPLKIINFNMADVFEYTCEHSVKEYLHGSR